MDKLYPVGNGGGPMESFKIRETVEADHQIMITP